MMNCHGCKYLDEVKAQPAGSGYCAMVVRSKSYRSGKRVRKPEMSSCELYAPGKFEDRHLSK